MLHQPIEDGRNAQNVCRNCDIAGLSVLMRWGGVSFDDKKNEDKYHCYRIIYLMIKNEDKHHCYRMIKNEDKYHCHPI